MGIKTSSAGKKLKYKAKTQVETYRFAGESGLLHIVVKIEPMRVSNTARGSKQEVSESQAKKGW